MLVESKREFRSAVAFIGRYQSVGCSNYVVISEWVASDNRCELVEPWLCGGVKCCN